MNHLIKTALKLFDTHTITKVGNLETANFSNKSNPNVTLKIEIVHLTDIKQLINIKVSDQTHIPGYDMNGTTLYDSKWIDTEDIYEISIAWDFALGAIWANKYGLDSELADLIEAPTEHGEINFHIISMDAHDSTLDIRVFTNNWDTCYDLIFNQNGKVTIKDAVNNEIEINQTMDEAILYILTN